MRYQWGDEVACNFIERSLPIRELQRSGNRSRGQRPPRPTDPIRRGGVLRPR
jgi:hypothetical protein